MGFLGDSILAASAAAQVRTVQIVGSTIYNATLQAIYDIVRCVTAKYGSDGYVLSCATNNASKPVRYEGWRVSLCSDAPL